ATVSRAVRSTTIPSPPNASMRAFEQDRLQQSPGALEVEGFSASEHEARYVFRLAALVGVNPESAGAALVVDLHLEAERYAFVAVELSRQLAADGIGLFCRL